MNYSVSIGERSIAMSVSVCLSLRSHVSLIVYPNFAKIFTHDISSRDSFPFRWRCDMLCTSGFVDDAMLAHNRARQRRRK